MTRTRSILTALAVLAALCLTPAMSNACDGCYTNSWFDRPAFGCSGSLYGLGHVPVPPYFALHPPVYYGQRYYRSYGESPFARGDYSSRPQRIRAQVIINPFVQQAASAPAAPAPKPEGLQAAPDQVTAARPQMIINPYYTPEAKVAGGK